MFEMSEATGMRTAASQILGLILDVCATVVLTILAFVVKR
jgi:hypothetical protein